MQTHIPDSSRRILQDRSIGFQVFLDSRAAQLIGYGLLAVLASVLLLYNLTTYPIPWFDEGYFLAVAQTLAHKGLYAVPNSTGAWVMDPSITTGPIVIVPLALMFKLFGVGIFQARVLAVAFGVASLVAYILVARRLVGGAALLAGLLLLVGNFEQYTSFIFLARQMVGEVAALGFWVYGVWLWLRTNDRARPRWWQWACVGLAFGLAINTKPQMLVGVVPALALTCLLDRYYYRQASWSAFIIPGVTLVGCFGAWYVAQIGIAGADAMQRGSAVLQSGVRSNIIGLDLAHMRHAVGTVWRSGFWLWGLPGLGYGIWCARRRDRHGLAHAWVLTLVLLWLAWYIVFSIGWARYGFVPFALTPIWTAGLLVTLFRRAPLKGRVALVALLLVLVASTSYTNVKAIVGPQDHSTAEFSAYLSATLPADAVIESWEWELESTTPHQFHHPPPLVMYTVIDLMQRDQAVPRSTYDPAVARAPYIIDGPFSSWTGIYHDYVTTHAEKIRQIGPYALYRVVR